MATNAFSQNNSETLPITTTEVGTMIMVSDNSVKGMSSVCTEEELRKEEILGSDDINLVLDEGVKYGDLIKCLIKCESGFNPYATGDLTDGVYLAYGILQFHKPTFDTFSRRYKMELDYKNPVHQIVLCDKMLIEDFGNVWHWTNCWKKCNNK